MDADIVAAEDALEAEDDEATDIKQFDTQKDLQQDGIVEEVSADDGTVDDKVLGNNGHRQRKAMLSLMWGLDKLYQLTSPHQ